MLVTGIILLILLFVFFIVYMVSSDEDESTHFGWGIVWTLGFICAVLITVIGASGDNPHKFKSSEHSVKTEIITTTVNGNVQSTDTVYIFTPKKK